MEIEKTLQSIREAVARAVVGKGEAVDLIPVSYTHLTLPTICSV